jgi:hypothetical protein
MINNGIWAMAVVAIGIGAHSAFAQPPARPADPFAETRARQQVADQKAQFQVDSVIRDADRMMRTNPARAVQLLKAAQTDIDLSVALTGETRKTLTTALQNRINQIQGRPVVAAPAQKRDPVGTTIKSTKAATLDQYRDEVKVVKEGLEKAAYYRDKNDNKKADEAIAKLRASYPDNPAVILLAQQGSMADNLKTSKMYSALQAQRIVAANNQVARSAIPPLGDIEFPENWTEITERRKTKIQLTEKERSLIEALNKPITVNYGNRPFEDVLGELSTMLNQPLALDAKSLTELGIDMKKLVSIQGNGIPSRVVLRELLAGQGLTFVIKGEMIQVMTVERARETLTTKIYYLGDLVQGVGPFGGALTWGPLVDFQQTMTNVNVIIEAIKSSIDPLCWKDKGGPCSIAFHFPSMSIIVRASTEVHTSIGSKFGNGK